MTTYSDVLAVWIALSGVLEGVLEAVPDVRTATSSFDGVEWQWITG